MSGQSFQDDEEPLVHNLSRLITEGGDGNFLIVSVGEVYIQFAGSRGATSVDCEAVSNQFLPAELQLGEGRLSELQALGFEVPVEVSAEVPVQPKPSWRNLWGLLAVTTPPPPNYSRTFDAADEPAVREIARTTLSILSDVYGCPTQSPIKYELELQ